MDVNMGVGENMARTMVCGTELKLVMAKDQVTVKRKGKTVAKITGEPAFLKSLEVCDCL